MYPYWPTPYEHWPKTYHYWPQAYFYWPTVVDLRGCIVVADEATLTITVGDAGILTITVTATGACGDMNTYDVGDQIRLSAVFANSAGTAVDPSALTLVVFPAEGTAVTYTYGVGTVIVRDSLGNYHADITVTARSGGTWYYKFTATGTYIGMQQGSFGVRVDETS